MIKEAGERLEEIPLLEAKITEIGEKYERKFNRRYRLGQITSVLRSIVGIAKGAKDITDAKAHLLKLLGD